jgi:hypothetical protein
MGGFSADTTGAVTVMSLVVSRRQTLQYIFELVLPPYAVWSTRFEFSDIEHVDCNLGKRSDLGASPSPKLLKAHYFNEVSHFGMF